MCDGVERILRKLEAQIRVKGNLILLEVLTVEKTRRDYSCRWSYMESGSSIGVHGSSPRYTEVRTWRLQGGEDIFVKVEC